MKKRIQHLSVLILAFSYLIASTGFGVHECLKNGSVDILIIKSDLECSEIHSHSCCVLPECETESHDENCCKTELYLLDSDYQLPEISLPAFYPTNVFNALFYLSFSTAKDSLRWNDFLLFTSLRDGPARLWCGVTFFASNSQWRL